MTDKIQNMKIQIENKTGEINAYKKESENYQSKFQQSEQSLANANSYIHSLEINISQLTMKIERLNQIA